MTFRNLYTAKLFHELFPWNERQRHYYSLCKNSNDLLLVSSKSISETLSTLLALLYMLKFKYIMKWIPKSLFFLSHNFNCFQKNFLIVFSCYNSSVLCCAECCDGGWWCRLKLDRSKSLICKYVNDSNWGEQQFEHIHILSSNACNEYPRVHKLFKHWNFGIGVTTRSVEF